MVKCSIKGCNKKAKTFTKTLKFCEQHGQERTGDPKTKFLALKQALQIYKRAPWFLPGDRTKAEETLLNFFAGICGYVPTPEDVKPKVVSIEVSHKKALGH